MSYSCPVDSHPETMERPNLTAILNTLSEMDVTHLHPEDEKWGILLTPMNNSILTYKTCTLPMTS